jgi:hypothetical protein
VILTYSVFAIAIPVLLICARDFGIVVCDTAPRLGGGDCKPGPPALSGPSTHIRPGVPDFYPGTFRCPWAIPEATNTLSDHRVRVHSLSSILVSAAGKSLMDRDPSERLEERPPLGPEGEGRDRVEETPEHLQGRPPSKRLRPSIAPVTTSATSAFARGLTGTPARPHAVRPAKCMIRIMAPAGIME